MKVAAEMGFYAPFDDEDSDLPGGKSAADLALDIIEKALDGSYNWDDKKQPNFLWFCRSRAKSILSNWLNKNRRMTVMSPILEAGENEEPDANAVSTATDGGDIYDVLRFREGGALGDQLLEDFALSLPDKSHEQAILFAIYDDRECICRSHCINKLKIADRDFDAAMKRIRRAGPGFLNEWCRKNNVKTEDRQEVR